MRSTVIDRRALLWGAVLGFGLALTPRLAQANTQLLVSTARLPDRRFAVVAIEPARVSQGVGSGPCSSVRSASTCATVKNKMWVQRTRLRNAVRRSRILVRRRIAVRLKAKDDVHSVWIEFRLRML